MEGAAPKCVSLRKADLICRCADAREAFIVIKAVMSGGRFGDECCFR